MRVTVVEVSYGEKKNTFFFEKAGEAFEFCHPLLDENVGIQIHVEEVYNFHPPQNPIRKARVNFGSWLSYARQTRPKETLSREAPSFTAEAILGEPGVPEESPIFWKE